MNTTITPAMGEALESSTRAAMHRIDSTTPDALIGAPLSHYLDVYDEQGKPLASVKGSHALELARLASSLEPAVCVLTSEVSDKVFVSVRTVLIAAFTKGDCAAVSVDFSAAKLEQGYRVRRRGGAVSVPVTAIPAQMAEAGRAPLEREGARELTEAKGDEGVLVYAGVLDDKALTGLHQAGWAIAQGGVALSGMGSSSEIDAARAATAMTVKLNQEH